MAFYGFKKYEKISNSRNKSNNRANWVQKRIPRVKQKYISLGLQGYPCNLFVSDYVPFNTTVLACSLLFSFPIQFLQDSLACTNEIECPNLATRKYLLSWRCDIIFAYQRVGRKQEDTYSSYLPFIYQFCTVFRLQLQILFICV